jgi:hypothetical protein
VSLADFLVISAEAIMSLSRTKHGLDAIDFKGQFRFGRRTDTACSYNVALPNPEHSCPATEKTFIDRMGLDWKGSAALMGVHTLGRAQKKNSGYEGHWSDPHNSRIFNNNYYVSILTKGWMPKKRNWERRIHGNWFLDQFDPLGFPDSTEAPYKTQWVRSDGAPPAGNRKAAFLESHEMMLDTDLCLMFYNGVREPLKASTDECCTWVPHARYSGSRADDWNLPRATVKKWLRDIKEEHGWCGFPEFPAGGTNRLHQQCCAGAAMRNCGNCADVSISQTLQRRNPRHCVELPVAMNGPAEKEVVQFAHNETHWLQEFLVAWQKATENGAVELKKLSA